MFHNYMITLRDQFKKHPELLAIVFFSAVFVLGVTIYHDFGMFIDDPNQKTMGEYAYNYIFLGDHTYLLHPDRDHGVIFQLLLTIAGKVLRLDSDQDIYFFRHLSTFITFYSGLFVFFLFCKKMTNNCGLGLIGALFLLISPRIFENAFYNSKDIPFLVGGIFAMYTLTFIRSKLTFKILLLHSFFSGLLIAIRIVGLYIIILTGIAWLITLLGSPKSRQEIGRSILWIGAYIILTYGIMVLLWPSLWPDPLGIFWSFFTKMSNYPYAADVLFLGKYISPQNLPWYYIPIWIAITTPLLYSFYFIAGLFWSIKSIIKEQFLSNQVLFFYIILVLSWFFIPLLSVIIMRSTLYNSWRHMFFIYPAFLCIALFGLEALSKQVYQHFTQAIIRMVIPISLVASLLGTVTTMLVDHPYESMYFNILAGKNMRSVRFRYELDYGATCYREALEKILTEDKSPTIPIEVTHLTGKRNAYLLPIEERQRLNFPTNESEVKYIIGDYHNRREDYSFGSGVNPWYRVSVDGVDLCVVYRLYH